MTSKLEKLRTMTTVVADTGDISAGRRLRPTDCTTNPTIVLNSLKAGIFADAIEEAVRWGKKQPLSQEAMIIAIADRLSISVGTALVKLIPGRVSTEIDADLSFDTQASIDKAWAVIAAYKERGIERDRVLVKIASTWEGVCAAKALQKEGIDCNLTLLFSKAQAIICADANVFMVSPFVGRISDWYKKTFCKEYNSVEDPGVLSVCSIYNYYKANDIKTVVMGASFRNIGQIEALAGCDRLTISPDLLEELDKDHGVLERKLSYDFVAKEEKVSLDEKTFRWIINEDAMATEKISEGIRLFNKDLKALRDMIRNQLFSL